MTMQKLSLPDCGSATLTLPDPLTPDVIGQLERGWHKLLLTLRRELRSDQPDPGDLEFASWAANMPAITSPKEIS
jgi:hypothetical protein